MQQTDYDYIIAGAGCAGLSLVMHLLQEPTLLHKRILLVDESPKAHNDRTWCFWEKEASLFEPVVCKQWDRLWFYSDTLSKPLSIAPYRYKMIRGIDFYRYCLAALQEHTKVTFLQGRVEDFFSQEKTGIAVEGKHYTAAYVFNSIPPAMPALRKKEIWLLQHFKGWVIETNSDVFHPTEATLMDFRISQKHGTAFCYVLPLRANQALVEYTLFTPSLLREKEYDLELETYIRQYLQLDDFKITETEFGVIPMTNHRFSQGENNIINIGTAGGQTKGSSGYTFYFIQQHSKKMVAQLAAGKHPRVTTSPRRFHFYDSVLLEVLRRNSMPGKKIFATLFEKARTADVLSFLNNASTLPQDIRIIATLPTLPFLKAAVRQVL